MSTAHSSLEELVGAVLKNLSDIIKMLDNVKELKESTQPFYKYKFPNVVGAIDGTMIEVHPPQREKLDFFTRKYNTSLNLTALCSGNKRFLYINVGQSARCYDSHIFQRSRLASRPLNRQYHIIGDAAYQLSENMMVPYVKPEGSPIKEIYNKTHSSTRMVIERSFGDLKNRWLRLSNLKTNIKLAN